MRRCTSVPAWRRRLEAAEHALAEAQAVRKQAETALNGANDRLDEHEPCRAALSGRAAAPGASQAPPARPGHAEGHAGGCMSPAEATSQALR